MDPIPLPPPVGGINEKVPLFSLQAPACESLQNFNITTNVASIRFGDSLFQENTTVAIPNIMCVSQYGDTWILVLINDPATNNIRLYRVGVSGQFAVYLIALAWAPESYIPSYFNGYSYFFATDGINEHSIRYTNTATVLSGYTAPAGIFFGVGGGCAVHNRRHYMPKYNDAGYFYSGIDAITGATKYVDLASILSQNARLKNIATFTLSQELSATKIVAFIFSSGEILFYTGDSPESANWGLAGTAKVGRPYEANSGTNYQGDYIIVTEQGIGSLRDLFLQGSQKAASLVLSDNIGSTFQSAVENYGAGAYSGIGELQGVVDVLVDPIKQNLLVCFPVAVGRPPPNGTTEGLTWFILNSDSLAWAIHTRRHISAPTHCSRSVYWRGNIYYVTTRFDTFGTQLLGFKVLKKEGADIFADVTSGILADPVGITFNYVSAPISNGRMYVQKATGMDVIIQSDINTSVNYQMIGDFGVTQTAQQKIPSQGAFAYRKPFVNLGLESSFIQYRISGTTPTDAGLSGYYLYGVNFWSEIGRSPR